MKKCKLLIYLTILISIILCVPSIIYLISKGTVDGFDSYYTYTLEKTNSQITGIIMGIMIIGLLLIYSILYLLTIKKEKKIYENDRKIIIFIAVISFIFMLILPYLSADIYYYMGDSWLASRYKENPYYTSVLELQEQGINDEILDNTGYWKNTTSVYGPLWNSIAKMLISISFGSVTVGLFIFKLVSYLIHIINCCLIYKITKSRKYMLLYGLNPLILIEFLSNVHNDIYLLLFILLTLYFLIRKKSIIFTIIFLALSISIKYSTVLLVPFILIYTFRKEKVLRRILFCLISGLSIIAFVVLLYLPYYRDMSIFTNMLVQGSKYSQSILSYILLNGSSNIFEIINFIVIPLFAIIYIFIVIDLLFKPKLTLKNILSKYNITMLLFIFVVLATFQKWYILWLIPTIMFQNKNMRKFILYLTITALIPSIKYFMVEGDPYYYGVSYSIKMLTISVVILVIDVLINWYIRSKNNSSEVNI